MKVNYFGVFNFQLLEVKKEKEKEKEKRKIFDLLYLVVIN